MMLYCGLGVGLLLVIFVLDVALTLSRDPAYLADCEAALARVRGVSESVQRAATLRVAIGAGVLIAIWPVTAFVWFYHLADNSFCRSMLERLERHLDER